MCMIDDADGTNEWQGEDSYTARKTHRCGECRREILKGERYTVVKWIYEREFSQSKICSHCQIAANWLEENCNGYLTTMIYEDIHDHVQEYKGRSKCISRLARLDFGMRRKWLVKRGPHAGQLMKIPQLPGRLVPA